MSACQSSGEADDSTATAANTSASHLENQDDSARGNGLKSSLRFRSLNKLKQVFKSPITGDFGGSLRLLKPSGASTSTPKTAIRGLLRKKNRKLDGPSRKAIPFDLSKFLDDIISRFLANRFVASN